MWKRAAGTRHGLSSGKCADTCVFVFVFVGRFGQLGCIIRLMYMFVYVWRRDTDTPETRKFDQSNTNLGLHARERRRQQRVVDTEGQEVRGPPPPLRLPP
jgi:hypothetical protein